MATISWHQGNTYAPTVKLTVTQSSQSVEGNSSIVSYKLTIERPSSVSSSASKAYSVVLNGATVASGTTTIGGSGTKTIASGSVTVPHNADGTKTVSFSFSLHLGLNWSGVYLDTATSSGSLTLTTIARATTPTVNPSSVTLGSAVTIGTPRASSSFTHTLSYKFGSASGTIASGVATQRTWTPPLSLASQIPNTTSGSCTITCKTYKGSTLIGTKSVSLTLNIPASVVPTFSGVTVTEGTTGVAEQFGAYVQTKSTLAVGIEAAGAYGSTIQQYSTTIQGRTYAGAAFTSEPLAESGTSTVTVSVTDSRNRKATFTTTLTVLAYAPPKIDSMTAYRINASGAAYEDGNKVAVTMSYAVAPVGDRNSHTYKLEYQASGGASFQLLAEGSASWTFSGTQSFADGPTLTTDSAFIVRLTVSDFFGSATKDFELPTAYVTMDFRSTGKGVAFGKVSEQDLLEIAMDVLITGKLIREAVQTPTLLNDWVNFGSAYAGAGYWRDVCGVVHLVGFIKSGVTTAGTSLFVLPVGYRPAHVEKFMVASGTSTGQIHVNPSGVVELRAGSASGLSLSGVTFRAE